MKVIKPIKESPEKVRIVRKGFILHDKVKNGGTLRVANGTK